MSIKEDLKKEVLHSKYGLEVLDLVSESWLKQLELELKLLGQESWLLTYIKGFSKAGVPVYFYEDELHYYPKKDNQIKSLDSLRLTPFTLYTMPRALFQVGNITELHLEFDKYVPILNIPKTVKIETVIISGNGRAELMEPLLHTKHLIIIGDTRRLPGKPEEVIDINPNNFPNVEKVSLYWDGWNYYPAEDNIPPPPRKLPSILYKLPKLKEIEVIKPANLPLDKIKHLLENLNINKLGSLERVYISLVDYDENLGLSNVIDVIEYELDRV